jgi:hypothetical protein
MARNVEAIAICIDRKMAEIAKAYAKHKGRVNPNNLMERAGNGRPKDRVDLDGTDDWAGNKCPKMRSTKVPNRSGHGFSVKTVNKDVSSGDNFSVAMARRSGVPARTMTSRTRRQEQPSGYAQLEQQLGGEDRAGVVCWQKPPGRTGIRRRHCRFFTGRCNEPRQRSFGQEADGRVAAPTSLKGLVKLLYERSPKKCKEAGGAQNNGMASPLRPSTKTSSGDNFSVACGHEVGSAGTDDKLDNEAAGAALRTRPTGAAAGGRRLCRCCLLVETPRMYQDTPEALPDL